MSTSSRQDPGPSGGALDPTNTTTVRRRLEERLRGRWAAINTEIRDGVRERDVLGLGERQIEMAEYDDFKPYESPTEIRRILEGRNEQKTAAFVGWLEEQIDAGVLEVIHRDENPYIRTAYKQGVQSSLTDFTESAVPQTGTGDAAQIEIDAETVQGGFNLRNLGNYGVHEDRLQQLFTRSYEDLVTVADDAVEAVREEMTRGFAEGVNPRAMARNITDRVDSIGKHQATVLARTETINAHSEGIVTTLEDSNVRAGVTVRSEWLDTDDDRTCPICNSLGGRVYETNEVRTATFEYEASEDEPPSLSGTYPVMPPAHPQCRCTLVPSFEE